MKNSILILFLAFQFSAISLEGKWKLTAFTAMDAILNSTQFNSSSGEDQMRVMESMNFTLDNTYYDFQGDSIFYTNAGGDMELTSHKGKFLLQSDTLMIFPSDKVKPIKFFISSFEKNELKMKVVYKDGSLGPSIMTFEKLN